MANQESDPEQNKETPSNMSVAAARLALVKSISQLDVETAGRAMHALDNIDSDLQRVALNPKFFELAARALSYATREGYLEQDRAKEILAVWEQEKSKAIQTPLATHALGLPIKQVAENARQEVSGSLENGAPFVSELMPGLTTLEKATLNLESINEIVADGTWLKEYLAKRNTSIRFASHPSWKKHLAGSLSLTAVGGVSLISFANGIGPDWGLVLEFIALFTALPAGGTYLLTRPDRNLYLDMVGVSTSTGTIREILTVKQMESFWNTKNKWRIDLLAGLDRSKSLSRILKSID